MTTKIILIKNIFVFLIPLALYAILSNYIQDFKDLILVTLIITTVIFWATSIIPNYQTSLIFLFTCLAFSLSSKDIIFSGFTSAAFWLVFAGILVASAIQNVNLSERFSSFFTNIKHPSYLKILIAINIFTLLFSFIMPSSIGRVVMLIPIAIMVAKSFGFKESDKGYMGIVLTFILSTTMPSYTILPSNVPNMILAGLAHELYNVELYYSHYLLENFLILGFIKNFFIVGLIYFFYKDTPKILPQKYERTALTKDEKIVIFVLALMLILWSTDFIHHISTSVIAVAGVLILANPAINIIKTKDLNTLNFSSLLLNASIISLGTIVSNDSFIKEFLANTVKLFEPTSFQVLNYTVISSFMAFCAIFTSQASVPAVFTPLAGQIANLSNFSLSDVLMMQVSAFSIVVFPFQSPPIFIGLMLANIRQVKALKILLALNFVTIFLLFPLQYFWLEFINRFF